MSKDALGNISAAMGRVKKGVNNVDLHIYLNEMYETYFGIYDHVKNVSNPLASVSMFASEDVITGSRLELSLNKYIDSGVKNVFGMTLSEYLEYPPYYIEALTRIAKEKLSKKQEELDDLENELNGTK